MVMASRGQMPAQVPQPVHSLRLTTGPIVCLFFTVSMHSPTIL